MNTCDTCKHWGSPHRDEVHGTCKCPKFVDSDTSDEQDRDTLRYGSYEGIGNQITTGPKFGCIHHQPKC